MEGTREGGVPSSGGATEVGGGEAQGQGTGQKMCKLFLVCYDGADGIRQRKLLRTSAERARARHQSCWCATGVQSIGSSVNLGLVTRSYAWSVTRQKPSASSPVRRSQRVSENKHRQRSWRQGQVA